MRDTPSSRRRSSAGDARAPSGRNTGYGTLPACGARLGRPSTFRFRRAGRLAPRRNRICHKLGGGAFSARSTRPIRAQHRCAFCICALTARASLSSCVSHLPKYLNAPALRNTSPLILNSLCCAIAAPTRRWWMQFLQHGSSPSSRTCTLSFGWRNAKCRLMFQARVAPPTQPGTGQQYCPSADRRARYTPLVGAEVLFVDRN